ncbi:hypothetical protein ACHAWT_006882 [Skeletonema menzelii]
MDLLSGYASSDSDEGAATAHHQEAHTAAAPTTLFRPPPGSLNAAPIPSVPAAILRSKMGMSSTQDQSTTSHGISSKGGGALILTNNPSKAVLHSSVQGPALLSDPNDTTTSFIRAIDPKTGSTSKIEANAAIDEYSFAKNRNAFQKGATTGTAYTEEAALAPGEVVREIQRNDYGYERRFPPNYGDTSAKEGEEGEETNNNGTTNTTSLVRKRPHSPASEPQPKLSRRARLKQQLQTEGPLVHDEDDDITYGIWGPPSATERQLQNESIPAVHTGVELHPRIQAERARLAERDRQRGIYNEEGGGGDVDNEKQKFDRLVERKMSHLLPPRLEGENPNAMEPETTFHGAEEVDYRGRSWIVPPSGVKGVDLHDVDDHACFVPKKCVARFTGHDKGVHRIRLFPRTGHLLLSAGLDGTCKVWSVAERKCMRTYVGHTAAVRDVQFNNDGSKFVSASFDRYLRLWDTESGKVLGTYTNRRVPYVVKFYPHDDNTFVVGCSDNKIVAYDSNTGEITQEYDHHLAPVNTINFVEDNGTKMVTSSDDKKVLVWEWDIGVPIKYISDPTMHSMPVITMHPSERYLVCQSLDNKILVYQAGDRFALQRKKKMEGHNTAGYACDIAISPDGRFVCSGDSDGKLFFWDFKRTRMLQKYHAHDKGPCIGAVWHPVEASTMFTCGWDGVIKMWQ